MLFVNSSNRIRVVKQVKDSGAGIGNPLFHMLSRSYQNNTESCKTAFYYLNNSLKICCHMMSRSYTYIADNHKEYKMPYVTFMTSKVITLVTRYIVPFVSIIGSKSVHTVFIFSVVWLLRSPEP